MVGATAGEVASFSLTLRDRFGNALLPGANRRVELEFASPQDLEGGGGGGEGEGKGEGEGGGEGEGARARAIGLKDAGVAPDAALNGVREAEAGAEGGAEGEAVVGAQAAEELRWEVSPAGPGELRATYIPTLAGPLRIVTRLDGKAVR